MESGSPGEQLGPRPPEASKPPDHLPRRFSEVWRGLPPRRRRSLAFLFASAVPGMCFWGLIVGAVFNDFVLELGRETAGESFDVHLPFLASLLPLCVMLRPAAVWWIQRHPDARKRVYVGSLLLSRLVWVPIAFVPFLAPADRPGTRLALLTAVLVVFGLSQTICASAWLSWVADLVPVDFRARYLGRRRAAGLVPNLVVAYLCSRYLDAVKADAPEALPEAFRNVWLLAVGLGLVQVLLMSFIEHVRSPARPAGERFWPAAREVTRDASFRRVVLVLALFFAASSFTGPFVSVLVLDRLYIPLEHLQVFQMLAVGTQMALLGLWGAFRERYGLRTALLAAMSMEALWPVSLFFARADYVTPVALAYVFFGIGWSGFFLVQQHMLLAYAKGKRGAVPLAVAGFTLAFVQFVAPNLARQLLRIPVGGAELRGQSWELLGTRLYDVHLIIGLSVLLRLAGFAAAMRLSVPPGRPRSGQVLRLFVTRNPMRAFLNFFLYVGGRVSERMGNGEFLARHPGGRWEDDFDPPTVS